MYINRNLLQEQTKNPFCYTRVRQKMAHESMPMYETIGNRIEKQEKEDIGHSKSTYTLPITSRLQTPNEYQTPQVTTKYEPGTSTHETDTMELIKVQDKNTKKCFITISIIMLFLLILTLVAVAIGALGFQNMKQTEPQVSTDALSTNGTYILN